MPDYRYRPRENRTPVAHPVYGSLVWDQLVRWPEPIDHPDFEEVKSAEGDAPAAAEAAPEAAADAAEEAPAATEPQPNEAGDAAKAARSK